MPNYADFQTGLYFAGLAGERPPYPLTFAGLEAAAREKLEHRLFDYVAGGAGDEHTQRGNVAAFERWGILPRMLSGAAERDLSVDALRPDLPTPLLPGARSASSVSCPTTSTATSRRRPRRPRPAYRWSPRRWCRTRWRTSPRRWATRPGFFQLYTPNDRELAESFVRRAEAAGFTGIVVTLDTWSLGYRPRDLAARDLPAAAGLLPGQLLLRPGLPLQARGAARGGPGRGRAPVGADLREPRP